MAQAPQVTEDSVGNLEIVLASFRRHLRAGNLAPRTIETYLEAAQGFREYLKRAGGPTDVALINQGDVEGFMNVRACPVEGLDREQSVPGTAAVLPLLGG